MKNTKPDPVDDPSPDESDVPPSLTLTGKQELALHAILTHRTLKEAALAAGVSEPTLWRYQQEKAFAARLRQARRDAMSHVLNRLQQASVDAVTVLHELQLNAEAPASARITAARTILDYSIRAVETDELRGEIEELKDFIRAKQEEESLDAGMTETEGEEEGEE